MASALTVIPPCAVCGTPAARIELVAPGQFPAGWDRWPGTVQDIIARERQLGQWYLLFKGVATENGYGNPIDAARAGQITRAFRPPLFFAQVHTAGFHDDAGFCQHCDAPYRYQHWHVTQSGYGWCPRSHGKSLDPHWSPLPASHQTSQTDDLLGVNELQEGRCWSLMQVKSLYRSHEVGAGRRGCCTSLLYRRRCSVTIQ
jgi:hypothetical protein